MLNLTPISTNIMLQLKYKTEKDQWKLTEMMDEDPTDHCDIENNNIREGQRLNLR